MLCFLICFCFVLCVYWSGLGVVLVLICLFGFVCVCCLLVCVCFFQSLVKSLSPSNSSVFFVCFLLVQSLFFMFVVGFCLVCLFMFQDVPLLFLIVVLFCFEAQD